MSAGAYANVALWANLWVSAPLLYSHFACNIPGAGYGAGAGAGLASMSQLWWCTLPGCGLTACVHSAARRGYGRRASVAGRRRCTFILAHSQRSDSRTPWHSGRCQCPKHGPHGQLELRGRFFSGGCHIPAVGLEVGSEAVCRCVMCHSSCGRGSYRCCLCC